MTEKSNRIPTPKTPKQYDRTVIQGQSHYDKGDYAQALSYFTKALDYKDYHPNLLVLMARCLFQMGMKNKAISLMEHALAQNAENPAICESLGSACLSLDLNELAIRFFTLYIQLNPTEPIGYNNLATALREDGQLDQSIQLLQEIIPIYPENAFLWNSAGAGVSFRDGYAAALPFYEEAWRLSPKTPIFASNLCLVYGNMGQYDKAHDFAKAAVSLAPNVAEIQRALAHSSLNIGHFDDAFEALAWHNHPSDPGSVFMPYDIQKWQGEPLAGKTIFIGAEQGIGDEIFFSGLYPRLISEAGRVIIGCDLRLVPLFQQSFPTATILPYVTGEHEAGYKVRLYDGLVPGDVDYMCLYTDVMRHHWRNVTQIPDMSAGFLHPPQDQTDHWAQKIAALPHDITVGICWRSGLKQAKRQMFYADIEDWLPILKTPKVNFVNVQYGDCQAEINLLRDQHGIKLHHFPELDLKDDLLGTAALMKNLDLVIGPATTPVAEAAAVGCRTWWLVHNMKPWWSFGQPHGTPLFKKNRMTIKALTLDWPSFMTLFAQEEFALWVSENG